MAHEPLNEESFVPVPFARGTHAHTAGKLYGVLVLVFGPHKIASRAPSSSLALVDSLTLAELLLALASHPYVTFSGLEEPVGVVHQGLKKACICFFTERYISERKKKSDTFISASHLCGARDCDRFSPSPSPEAERLIYVAPQSVWCGNKRIIFTRKETAWKGSCTYAATSIYYIYISDIIGVHLAFQRYSDQHSTAQHIM